MKKFDRTKTPDNKERYCVTCHGKPIDMKRMLEENNKHNKTLAGI